MFDDLEKFSRVQRNEILAGNLRIDIGGVRNAERIVRMNRQDLGLGPDKLFQILAVANDDVIFGVFAQQQRLDHAQAVRHILGAAIRPRVVNQGFRIDEGLAEFGWDGG